MPVISSTLGNVQASDLAVETALPVTGNPSREDGQSVLTSMDTLFGNILEDRNARFVGGGAISFDAGGTTLTFGERLDFTYNNAGTQEIITSVVAASGTLTFSANNHLAYVVLTKGSPGSVILTSDATSLPAATTNQEVFLVAIRRDDTSSTKRVYLYNQLSIDAGQTLPSGVPSTTTFTDAAFDIVNVSDATKVLNTSLSGSSASTTTTIATSSTANHTLTLPNTTDTLAVLGTAQTFTARETFSLGTTTTNSSSTNTTITSGTSLSHPQLTISGGTTYTVNSGGFMFVLGTLTVSGTLTNNGTVRTL